MGSRRDWRRVGAASATVSAGAVVFFAVGAGPASAETSSKAGECKLGPLLCSILSGGKGSPSAPPKSSGGSSSKPGSKPSSKPKPQPKPRSKPASGRSPHSGSGSRAGSAGGSGGSGAVNAPITPPAGAAGNVPEVAAPQQEGPALPDIVGRDPLVYPQEAPAAQDQATSARLMAASDPESDSVPPLLVATASGLVGAVTALNLSVLGRRLRRPR
ncbi:hypothetical protein [Actinoallomurus soli]|uniref:hypothetical protein n=1 Tax=Actinoallomurus soli TaxID=2952535 RepID=UPI0020923B28|nr:hypothetical protein [Actinoallomurus soli]MCO5974361.1 hypothetical protein [Actinoallomurus soli]